MPRLEMPGRPAQEALLLAVQAAPPLRLPRALLDSARDSDPLVRRLQFVWMP